MKTCGFLYYLLIYFSLTIFFFLLKRILQNQNLKIENTCCIRGSPINIVKEICYKNTISLVVIKADSNSEWNVNIPLRVRIGLLSLLSLVRTGKKHFQLIGRINSTRARVDHDASDH